jgi:hypothetical protein
MMNPQLTYLALDRQIEDSAIYAVNQGGGRVEGVQHGDGRDEQVSAGPPCAAGIVVELSARNDGGRHNGDPGLGWQS